MTCSRLLVLGCFIGGLQMAACLALLVPSLVPGAAAPGAYE